MAQYLSIYLLIAGALSGAGYAAAAFAREWFRGRALLIRAQRGDPETLIVLQLPVVAEQQHNMEPEVSH